MFLALITGQFLALGNFIFQVLLPSEFFFIDWYANWWD